MQDTLNFTERIGFDDRETLRAKNLVPPFDAGAPVVRDGFRFAGTHLLLDLWNAKSLDDVEAMKEAFRSAVDAAGATLLNLHFHRFACGGGLSGLALLAESHISIHTWPEHSFAAADIFMCGGAHPYQAAQVLRDAHAARVHFDQRTSAGDPAVKWFQEQLYPGFSQCIAVTDCLLERQTQFQKIQIFETPVFGKVLALDNAIQITERDNHIYHEMLVHVPMFAHGNVKDVLIVGGGDGGCLREVLKHPVDSVTMVEIDTEVVELSRRFFPEVSGGAFLDDRADILIDDAYRYLAEEKRRFDLILIDSTDPVGAAARLFTQEFYQRCFLRLRSSGMIVIQSGSPPFRTESTEADARPFMSVFGQLQDYIAPVPSYPMGMIALRGASMAGDSLSPCIETIRARFEKQAITTKHYEPGTHRAAFELLRGGGALVAAGQKALSL